MCPFYILSTCPSKGLCTALTHTHTHTHTHSLSLTTVHSVSHTARSRRLEGKLHDQPPTAKKHTPSLYTQNSSHLPNSAFHNIESIGSVRGFRARFASQSVQFGASERVSRVNWFSSGLQSAFRESFDSVRGFRARFASQLVQFGLQSAFRESFDSVRGFRARFASQLGASERVSRVNQFSLGLQSAFSESFDSVRGFRARFRKSIGSVRGFRSRFASQLVQFGASEHVSRVNWFSSGLQIAFRESIGSVWGFRSCFASQTVQFGASERVSRVI